MISIDDISGLIGKKLLGALSLIDPGPTDAVLNVPGIFPRVSLHTIYGEMLVRNDDRGVSIERHGQVLWSSKDCVKLQGESNHDAILRVALGKTTPCEHLEDGMELDPGSMCTTRVTNPERMLLCCSLSCMSKTLRELVDKEVC